MKQKVLISIDTEGPAGNMPVESLIYGKTVDGREYGIHYLMDFFDHYGAKGLFFVDIAEAWECGKDKIENVLRDIDRRGHDIGVHLHPDRMADNNRRYLWQYSYEEQYKMLFKCTEFYEKVLHRKPLSFRAGRYGADNQTIGILSELGYKYEMSGFCGNRFCKMDAVIAGNKVIKIGDTGLTEVPVTSYKSFSNPLYSRFDKIDCSMDTNEFVRVMKRIESYGSVDIVSFFVHSFSALNWRRNPEAPVLDKIQNRRLIEKLEWIRKESGFEYISESDIPQETTDSENREGGLDRGILDVSNGIVPYWFFIKRAMSVLRAKVIRNV